MPAPRRDYGAELVALCGAMRAQAKLSDAALDFDSVGYQLLATAEVDCQLRLRLVRCMANSEVQLLCQGTNPKKLQANRSAMANVARAYPVAQAQYDAWAADYPIAVVAGHSQGCTVAQSLRCGSAALMRPRVTVLFMPWRMVSTGQPTLVFNGVLDPIGGTASLSTVVERVVMGKAAVAEAPEAQPGVCLINVKMGHRIAPGSAAIVARLSESPSTMQRASCAYAGIVEDASTACSGDGPQLNKTERLGEASIRGAVSYLTGTAGHKVRSV